MNSTANPLSKSALCVRTKIKDWILRNGLRPGERLPAERELMVKFKTSRSAIRAALGQLEADRVILTASPRIRVVAEAEERTSGVIAVISGLDLPNNPAEIPLSHISPQQLLGVIFALQSSGLRPLILPPFSSAEALQRQLASAGANGAVLLNDIFHHRNKEAALAFLRHTTIPTCSYVDTLSAAEIAQIPGAAFSSDHAKGCSELVRHLAQRGCRTVLRVWPERFPASRQFWFTERNRGYDEGCRAVGIAPADALYIPSLEEGDTFASFDAQVRVYVGFLLERLTRNNGPVGLLALNDGTYHYLAAACRRLGFLPGKDVLITGYDNYWFTLHRQRHWESSVPEATMSLGYRAAGMAVSESLHRQHIAGRPAAPELTLYPSVICLPEPPNGQHE